MTLICKVILFFVLFEHYIRDIGENHHISINNVCTEVETMRGEHTIKLYVSVSYFLGPQPLYHSNIHQIISYDTDNAQKVKFSIKDFFSKCDQIRRKLRIWSYFLKKSLLENFIFCAVWLFTIISSEFNYFFTRTFQLILIGARESLFKTSAGF